MQAFQLVLRFPVVAWVLDGIALGVSVEGFQAHINPYLFARGEMFDLALCFDTEVE